MSRLPDDLVLGPVRLRVADRRRAIAFYDQVLGLVPTAEHDGIVALAPRGGGAALLELMESPGARPVPRRGRTGLFHFAILVPDRAALGRFVRHAAELGVPLGAGDHAVSEAFYLHDLDGLGIEVYRDRPRAEWRQRDGELVMGTDPVDVDGVLAAAGDAPWEGMPAGTVMGHVHLHVGDLGAAGAFYGDALGMDRTVWSYPGALFLSAGGYHHHLGTNTWAGTGASAPFYYEAALLHWTLRFPSTTSRDAAAARLASAGHAITAGAEGTMVADPWGTRLVLATG